jgi:peptide/nickel transport system ATP-binding protein
MLALRDRLHTSIIMITHDLGVIAEVCDDVNVMYAGKIMEKSDVFELFDQPAHPYTQGLLRSIPSITEEGQRKRLDSIEGMVPHLLYLPKGCRFHPRCENMMDICRHEEPALFDLGNGHHVRCWLYKERGETV